MNEQNFKVALQDVVSNILEKANAERKETKPWKDLFAASEEGLRGILSNTELQCVGILLSTADVIKEKFKIKNISKELWQLIKALPFAMHEITNEIQKTQGLSCCADKAREVYYKQVLAEIKKIQEEENV